MDSQKLPNIVRVALRDQCTTPPKEKDTNIASDCQQSYILKVMKNWKIFAFLIVLILAVSIAVLLLVAGYRAPLNERVGELARDSATPKGTSTGKEESLEFADTSISYQSPKGWSYMGKEGREENGYVQVRYWSPEKSDGSHDASLSVVISKAGPQDTLEYVGNKYASRTGVEVKPVTLSSKEAEIVEYEAGSNKKGISVYAVEGGYVYEITGLYEKDAPVYASSIREVVSSVVINE